MTNKRQHHPKHPYLAQMLFVPVVSWRPCQGAVHVSRSAPRSGWEVRFYQDADRMVELYQAGVSEEEIAEAFWSDTCREQDSVGIVVHKTLHLCDDCTMTVLGKHGGDAGAFLNFTSSVITRQPILLVSDRLTEKAGLLGGLPADVQEADILAQLDKDEMLKIQF